MRIGWGVVLGGLLAAVAAVAAPAGKGKGHEEAGGRGVLNPNQAGEIRGRLAFCDGSGVATVSLTGVNVTARTGPSGEFVLHWVPPGAWELVAAKKGGTPYSVPVQVDARQVVELGTLAICADADGDGFDASVDCDDNNPSIFPGAPERCGDGRDNNCDGVVDEGCLTCTDADADGFYAQAGCGTVVDCDDADASVNPQAPELCNGVDDDCDGQIDEDFAFHSDPFNCGGCGHVCGAGSACVDGACTAVDADGDGYTVEQGDCNDNNPLIHPGRSDPCNGIDDDCDGEIDEDAFCNDGNPCTVDVCMDGCRWIPMTGMVCADGKGQCSSSGICEFLP